jgi:hypothetical protein
MCTERKIRRPSVLARWVLQVDNADEMAEWNKSLSDLLRSLARKEAEAGAKGQPVNEKPYNLIADIDRYLTKHCFITQRQLAVLVDIAKQHDVALPPLPSQGGI